jgi:FAD:protein FMN transferase
MRPDHHVAARHFEALGTSCSLHGVGAAPSSMLEAELWVRELGSRLTRFSQTSELAMLNSSGGRWVHVSPDLEALLSGSLRAFELSGGLVNVAILPSMMATGYTRSFAVGPTAVALEEARPAPQLPRVLEVKPGLARLAPGAGLDLGGIAKGWMADRLSERLGGNSVVNLGGDLVAHGEGPDGTGWPIGMAGTTLMLRDQAAATSSLLRRRWGDGVHHLIDPRTGRPADTGLAEVSVVADTGAGAEVIAKTALLVGPRLAPAFCAAHALAWWLLPGGTHDD